LARLLGVGQSVISNWRKRGTTPDAIYCSQIEQLTEGRVTRKMFYPDSWHVIWPELANRDELTIA
jgi:DNA-binding transcriptional regulator YdaS (Cro superfamily)